MYMCKYSLRISFERKIEMYVFPAVRSNDLINNIRDSRFLGNYQVQVFIFR